MRARYAVLSERGACGSEATAAASKLDFTIQFDLFDARRSFAPRASPKLGPQIRRGYPLNLSILISGGKETNQDSPSNGE